MDSQWLTPIPLRQQRRVYLPVVMWLPAQKQLSRQWLRAKGLLRPLLPISKVRRYHHLLVWIPRKTTISLLMPVNLKCPVLGFQPVM